MERMETVSNGDKLVVTICNGRESSGLNNSEASVELESMKSNEPQEVPTEEATVNQQSQDPNPGKAEPATQELPLSSPPEKDEEERRQETEAEKEELVFKALNKIEYEIRKSRMRRSKRVMFAVVIERITFVCLVWWLVATSSTLDSRLLRGRRTKTIWGIETWKWSVLALAILSGRILAEWSVNILIKRNFLLGQKVLYLVNKLKKKLVVFIWFGLILVAWAVLIEEAGGVERSRKTRNILNYVTRGLGCCFVGAFLWLGKALLVQMLATSSHVARYYDRIRKSVFDEYLLGKLLEDPRSATDLRDGRSSFSIQVVAMVVAIKGTNLTTKMDIVEGKVKEAAEQIFEKVAKTDRTYIDEKDLLLFMVNKDVNEAIPLFDGASETKKINDSSFKKWLVEAHKDRKSLENSLNNTKTAKDELESIVTGITVIATIIVWLLLMGVVTTKVILVIASQFVLVAFMFGNTCKNIFESVVFVFVTHPFDLDDRCSIDGVHMVVEEMKLLTTIFLRYDGEKINYPNSVLATKPISNFYRSPPMGDSVEFTVDFSTSKHTIEKLKEHIRAYLESLPHRWSKEHSVVVKDIINVNMMKIGVYVTHTINFQNYGKRNTRRSDFLLHLKEIFEDLNIEYHLLPQQVHVTHSTPPPICQAKKTL